MCFWFHTVKWLRNPAPVENGGLFIPLFYAVSIILAVVHDSATIHSMGGSFKISSVCKPWFLPWFFHVFYGVKSCHGGAGCSEQIPQQSETIRLGCQITNLFSGFYIYIVIYTYIYIYPHIVCVLLNRIYIGDVSIHHLLIYIYIHIILYI